MSEGRSDESLVVYRMTLTARTRGLAFAHVLELRPKLAYDPAIYLTLHRTL